jgi:hypothetical protein
MRRALDGLGKHTERSPLGANVTVIAIAIADRSYEA